MRDQKRFHKGKTNLFWEKITWFLKKEYLGSPKKLDFQESYDVLEAVNDAVNKATFGNFPNFLESIPPNTLMVALSALYIECEQL